VNLGGNPAFNMAPSDVIYPDLDPAAVPTEAMPLPAQPDVMPPDLVPMPPAPPPPPGGLDFTPPPSGYGQIPATTQPPIVGPAAPGALTPQLIQQAAPPVGTQARFVPPPGARPISGTGPAAPAFFQPQAAGMVAPVNYQQPVVR
jgi:hypothetical protein